METVLYIISRGLLVIGLIAIIYLITYPEEDLSKDERYMTKSTQEPEQDTTSYIE